MQIYSLQCKTFQNIYHFNYCILFESGGLQGEIMSLWTHFYLELNLRVKDVSFILLDLEEVNIFLR